MSDHRVETRAFSKTAHRGRATGTRLRSNSIFPYGSFFDPFVIDLLQIPGGAETDDLVFPGVLGPRSAPAAQNVRSALSAQELPRRMRGAASVRTGWVV